MAGELDDLIVVVGGDISPLQDALAGIPAAMAGVSNASADAFAGLDTTLQNAAKSATEAGASLGTIGEQAQKAAADSAAVDDAIKKLGESAQTAGEAAKSAADGWQSMTPALNEAGDAAKSTADSFEGLFLKLAGGMLTFQALKGAVEETITAFGNLERSTEALGAITKDVGGAADNIQRIVQLSDELAVPQQSFLTLTQRLVALGVAFSDIPRTLEGITDGARAMNQSIDTVGQRFDMVINSGTLMNRTLTAMGLTIQDVGKAMDMAAQSDQVIKDSFKGIADESERAAVLTEALWSKFGDLASKTANDTLGAWQQIKNAGMEAFQDLGQALDGFKGTVEIVSIAIKGLATLFLGLVVIVKEVVDVLIGVGGTMSSLFAGMSKATTDMLSGNFAQAKATMQGAVESATNYAAAALDNIKKDWNDTSASIDKLWVGAMGTVRDESAKTIPHIDAVIKAHKDLIQTLINGADMLLAKMPQTYETYINALSEGGKSAQSLLSSVSSEIDKFIGKMQELGGATPKLLSAYGDLIQQQQKLKEWVDQDNFSKMAVQVDQFAVKYGDSIGKLDIDTLNFVNAMQAAARDVPDALNKISDASLLGKVMESIVKVDESTKRWNETLLKAADSAKKLGVDMVESIDSPILADLAEMSNRTQGWTKLLFDAVTPMGKLWAVQEAMKSSGIAITQEMQNNIALLERQLVVMEETHKSYSDILQAMTLIAQKHIALNEAIGASGTATLAWTIQLEKVKVEHQAIIDQTMGLSKLYTGMVKEFGKAWDDAGKGIADAIVSGQNFGQVMTNVFDTLKKQIAELVAQYFMTQLKDAILTNTDLLGNFSKVFTNIFGGDGGGGLVAKGIGELDKSIATVGDSIAKTGQDAVASIQQTTAQASTGIQQVATQMSSVILPAISAIGAVIGAITGIIGNLEMAHMEKTLGEIETNTRKIDISIEGTLLQAAVITAQKTTTLLDWMQGTITTLLIQINGDLDDIAANIKGITTTGIPVSAGAADQSAQLLATIKDLKAQIDQLNTQINGAYGLPGSGLPAGAGAGTANTTTPQGSAAVPYSQLSSGAPLAVPVTLADRLLISISENIASILVIVSDMAKKPLGDVLNEVLVNVKAGLISLPLQAIADALKASAEATQGVVDIVGGATGATGPFVTLSTATTDLGAATTGLGTATTGLANTVTTATAAVSTATAVAVNGINTTLAAVTPTIQAVATVVNGINTLMAAVVPAVQAAVAVVLGVNSTTLLPTHPAALPNVTTPTGPSGSNALISMGGGQGLQGPGTINMNVNITGGGGAAVARDIVNTLQSMGVKVV